MTYFILKHMNNISINEFVNGPINLARLEGDIFDIHKIIYVFMDVHTDISTQTECKNFDSIDITQYIIKMLKFTDNNKFYDFFTEITSTAITSMDQYHISSYRGRYIDEINKYFKSEFNSDKKIKTNPHIRIHYMDIRDFHRINIIPYIHKLADVIRNVILVDALTIIDFTKLMISIKKLESNIKKIYTIMFEDSSSSGRLRPKNYKKIKHTNKNGNENENENKNNLEQIRKFIKKILSRYSHPELFTQFTSVLNSIKTRFNLILDLLDKITNLLKDSYNFLSKPNDQLFVQDYKVIKLYTYGKDSIKLLDFTYNFELLINQIDILCSYNFATITDLFFLRRFLDKDYITNAIIYTGVAHSIFYIHFLIKNYNFKITNVSYSSISDLNELENLIKKSDFDYKIGKIFMPQIFSQCINVTNFPKGFE